MSEMSSSIKRKKSGPLISVEFLSPLGLYVYTFVEYKTVISDQLGTMCKVCLTFNVSTHGVNAKSATKRNSVDRWTVSSQ